MWNLLQTGCVWRWAFDCSRSLFWLVYQSAPCRCQWSRCNPVGTGNRVALGCSSVNVRYARASDDWRLFRLVTSSPFHLISSVYFSFFCFSRKRNLKCGGSGRCGHWILSGGHPRRIIWDFDQLFCRSTKVHSRQFWWPDSSTRHGGFILLFRAFISEGSFRCPRYKHHHLVHHSRRPCWFRCCQLDCRHFFEESCSLVQHAWRIFFVVDSPVLQHIVDSRSSRHIFPFIFSLLQPHLFFEFVHCHVYIFSRAKVQKVLLLKFFWPNFFFWISTVFLPLFFFFISADPVNPLNPIDPFFLPLPLFVSCNPRRKVPIKVQFSWRVGVCYLYLVTSGHFFFSLWTETVRIRLWLSEEDSFAQSIGTVDELPKKKKRKRNEQGSILLFPALRLLFPAPFSLSQVISASCISWERSWLPASFATLATHTHRLSSNWLISCFSCI